MAHFVEKKKLKFLFSFKTKFRSMKIRKKYFEITLKLHDILEISDQRYLFIPKEIEKFSNERLKSNFEHGLFIVL